MGITTYARVSRSLTGYLASLMSVRQQRLFASHAPRGFTIAELMVVVAVSGVLLVAGLSILNPTLQINRGNDAKRKANLAKIQTALELFRSDKSYYPASSIGLNALFQGTPQYLPKSPNGDPKASDVYYYSAVPSGCDNITTGLCTGYTLITCLQNTADAERDAVNDAVCVSPLWSKTVSNP